MTGWVLRNRRVKEVTQTKDDNYNEKRAEKQPKKQRVVLSIGRKQKILEFRGRWLAKNARRKGNGPCKSTEYCNALKCFLNKVDNEIKKNDVDRWIKAHSWITDHAEMPLMNGKEKRPRPDSEEDEGNMEDGDSDVEMDVNGGHDDPVPVPLMQPVEGVQRGAEKPPVTQEEVSVAVVESRANSMETQTVAMEPRTVAMEPRTVAMDPRTVAMDPRTVAMDPRTVAMDPRTVAMEPRTVAMEPRTVAMDPRTVVMEPRTVAMEPRTVAMEPRTVAMDPRTVAMDPRTVAMDPRTVAMDPRTVAMDPRTVAMDPRSIPMDTQRINRSSLEMSTQTSHLNVTASPMNTRATPPVVSRQATINKKNDLIFPGLVARRAVFPHPRSEDFRRLASTVQDNGFMRSSHWQAWLPAHYLHSRTNFILDGMSKIVNEFGRDLLSSPQEMIQEIAELKKQFHLKMERHIIPPAYQRARESLLREIKKERMEPNPNMDYVAGAEHLGGFQNTPGPGDEMMEEGN